MPWKCYFPPSQEIMRDRPPDLPTNQPSNRQTDQPMDGHSRQQVSYTSNNLIPFHWVRGDWKGKILVCGIRVSMRKGRHGGRGCQSSFLLIFIQTSPTWSLIRLAKFNFGFRMEKIKVILSIKLELASKTNETCGFKYLLDVMLTC